METVTEKLAKSGRRSRRRQQEIAGTERPVIAELEEVLVPYVEAKLRSEDAAKVEKDLRAKTLQRMRELGIPMYAYVDGPIEVRVFVEEKDPAVKIQRLRVRDAIEEHDDDGDEYE